MKHLRLMLAFGAAAALAASLLGSRPATAEKPSICQQWEVMQGQPVRTVADVRSLPELGKPFVEPSPVGWEPFAFGPSGQLVFRRCAR